MTELDQWKQLDINNKIIMNESRMDKLQRENKTLLDTLRWVKSNCASSSCVEVYQRVKEALEKVDNGA